MLPLALNNAVKQREHGVQAKPSEFHLEEPDNTKCAKRLDAPQQRIHYIAVLSHSGHVLALRLSGVGADKLSQHTGRSSS